MSIVFAGLVPHPPLLIPDIGGGERDRVYLTDQALTKLAGLLLSSEPDTLIIITPHGPVFSDAIAILYKSTLKGDFGQFRAPFIRFTETIDIDFAIELQKEAARKNIMVALMDEKNCNQYKIEDKLDHGIMVPLYYIRNIGVNAQLLPVSMGMLPYEDLYKFGSIIAKVSDKLNKRIAVVASGDLSHRLTPEAPAGYNPHGKEFDEFLVKALKKYNIEDLLSIDKKLIEKAGECGLRPLIMMLGSLDGLEVDNEVISYEGPFGVGYCVAAFKPTGKKTSSKIELLYDRRAARLKGIQDKEHPLVRLARQAINEYIKEKKITNPEKLTPEMKEKAGVFVSIKKHGQLRGCIGTITPARNNLAEEIIHNAISAATGDPRFFPIEEDELEELTITVDVLEEPEEVDNIKALDPTCYGVVVRQGNKSGLLLPDLDGIETAKEQVEIAKRKAGIYNDKNVELFRFKVRRYF